MSQSVTTETIKQQVDRVRRSGASVTKATVRKAAPRLSRGDLPEILPDIFEYQEYRAYLKDVLKVRQNTRSGYSLVKFAKALGFSSHSGLAMVLTGKRELRGQYIDGCVRDLKLSIRQQLYFEAMVRSGASSLPERRALLREMEFHATKWEPPVLQEGIRLLDFFLVQQILSLYRGGMPVSTIVQQFRYAVKRAEVEAVLAWMLERGYVEKIGSGWRIRKSVLMVKDEVPNASAKQFHKDCMTMAAAALDNDPIDARECQTYLFTVDSKRIPEMKQWLKKLVLEAIAKFEDELEGDTVVQTHFNLFEMSNRIQRG